MTAERLQYLIQKILVATATPDELEELAAAVKADTSGLLAERVDATLRQQLDEVPAYDQQQWSKVASQILDADKHPSTSRERQSSVRWLTHPRMWWAAAAVLLIISAVVVQLFIAHKTALPVVHIPHTPLPADIAPGSNGAILTLADGRQVLLDSANNGQITQEGNSVVTKQDGRIVYEPAAAPANYTPVYNTMTTPRGRQYQLVLPDGSKVWLNAGSSITYPTAFTGAFRQVRITGEAYFEVTHLATSQGKGNMPFKVMIPPTPGRQAGAEIEVVGTHFNINAYGNEHTINATLLEGSVKVKPVIGNRRSTIGNEQSVLLKPGQQAQLLISSQSLKSPQIVVQTVDVEQVVAWKNGYFNFDNADIKTVLRQLERWYDIEVVFEGTVADRPILGKMQRELYLSQVLNILKKLGVNYRQEGKKTDRAAFVK